MIRKMEQKQTVVSTLKPPAAPPPLHVPTNWWADALSGLVVSLIALPLCLGIAGASGFPPVMGVITAIIGGLVVSWISGAPLTIKGPAAGLIVIVAAAVEDLGQGDPTVGWLRTAALVAVSGVLQVVLSRMRLAEVADSFSISAVKGMLASIGLIIIAKQVHWLLGLPPNWFKDFEPLQLLGFIPYDLLHLSWPIALIGAISLGIMFWPAASYRRWLGKIPRALPTLAVGIALGQLFQLHDPRFQALQPMLHPGELHWGVTADFGSGWATIWPLGIKYLLMLTIIGSMESLLTCRAIDLLDPQQRRSNLSKDLRAIGWGNLLSGWIGGLPMISEVARSSANIDNGGQSRLANFFHGVALLLLLFVCTPLIQLIPMATLSAMLVFVGIRLADPRGFLRIIRIGKEQFLVFLVTITATLLSDLLVGILAGMFVEMLLLLVAGFPRQHLMGTRIAVRKNGPQRRVVVEGSLCFANYAALKKVLDRLPRAGQAILDLRQAQFIDHTVMKNLFSFQLEYEQSGGHFAWTGLEAHRAFSDHPLASRRILE